jgi:hypothetical protein
MKRVNGSITSQASLSKFLSNVEGDSALDGIFQALYEVSLVS